MTDYLDLGRQFMPFQDEESWEVQYQSFLSDEFYGCEGWPSLLENKRIVILAEAGAGKTAEMREKAMALVHAGSTAFFATVNELAVAPFSDSLFTAKEKQRFHDWLNGNCEAIFFLDSVDEARLSGRSLRSALSRLANDIEGHAARATILISCRVSDWRATQDLNTVKEILCKPSEVPSEDWPLPPGGDDEALYAPLFSDTREAEENEEQTTPISYELHVVALAPLTLKQAKRLAEFVGVSNSEEFIQAVRDADAEDLVNRPQDLLNLASLWRDRTSVGSKYEILKWSIVQRLRETNLDLSAIDALSEESAHVGAKAVAAALTFGQRRFIAWPLDTPTSAADALSLNPQDVLQDWSGQLQKTLLNRALFDPASHGRVRFHHRSVQELLCAEWLCDQLSAGCPIRRIWALLAEEKYGSVRIRPAMRPVTAWLAQLNTHIRHLVLRVSPDLLIEGGDPELLPIAARETVLAKFAETYRGRNDAGVSIDIDQIERLADPVLAKKIRALWNEGAKDGELRELLLRIIWIGKIKACSDIALRSAMSRWGYYERLLGAKAIAEFGNSSQRRKLADHLIKYARTYPKKAFAEALQAVFPSTLTIDELEELIRKSPPDNMKAIHSGLYYGLTTIVQSAYLPDKEGLVILLQNLAMEKPWIDQRYRHFSKRFTGVRAPLADLCARLIRDADSAEVTERVAEATRLVGRISAHSGEFQIEKSAERLSKAVSNNSAVNRQLYWSAVKEQRAKNVDLWGHLAVNPYGELWRIQEKDLDWLLSDLMTRTHSNDKTMALGASLQAWNASGRDPKILEKIQGAVAGSAELESQLESTLNPPAREEEEWEREHAEQTAELKARREADRSKVKESWREFRDRLVSDPTRLADGKAVNDLYHLARWLGLRNRRDSYSLSDWQSLASAFSPEVAESARLGFIAYWRTYDPGVAKARKSSTPVLALIALIGLEIESKESPNFLTGCTKDEVACATVLALYEMNGFPDWAPNLWISQPKTAERVLRNEARWELARTARQGAAHHVIAIFAYAEEPFRSLAANWMLCELEEKTPRNDAALSRALDVIAGAERDFTSRLALLAASRFGSERRISRRLVWLAIWLGVDSNSALDHLDLWIKKQRAKSKQDDLVMNLLNGMFDSGVYRFGSQYRDFAKFESVTRLLRIAYAHVRRDDDREHEGSYSPNARDNAEQARSNLLGILLEIPGEQTYWQLIEMSEEPNFETVSERFRVLADRRATADADLVPWKPADVVRFQRDFERAPSTLEDLHQVVLDRLWDIEDEMQVGRFSGKAALRQDHLERAEERVVQLGIAEQLRLRASGAYSLEREPELESHDEPDISIQRAGIEEALPVEIKVADSWSCTQLTEAISGQLIGQYMRPRSATCGHLVITHHGKKRYWRPGKGCPQLDFPRLVQSLQAKADEFANADSDIDRVSVTGIDLTESLN
ncbi:MAG: hypothetical protein IIA05_04400 [Proteobacteria bacterium]|nr:hypothetical protein [Pseudomonadota bacterium]